MENLLKQHAKTMGIELTNDKINLLILYAKHIEKWNRHYNLTAINGFKNIIVYHILDSLSIINFISGGNKILDIGAGAGLPAVVIAVVSDNAVTAVDKVNKKCRFMQFVKAELGLANLSIVHSRVEDLNTDIKFDIITTRAFANIKKTLNISRNLLRYEGHYLIMKGNNWQQENTFGVKIIPHRITVPDISTQRYILEITL